MTKHSFAAETGGQLTVLQLKEQTNAKNRNELLALFKPIGPITSINKGHQKCSVSMSDVWFHIDTESVCCGLEQLKKCLQEGM